MRADFADFEPRYVTSLEPSGQNCPKNIHESVHSQRPEAHVIRQIDAKVAPHGSRAVAQLGSSEGTRGALGRCVSSDVGMSRTLTYLRSSTWTKTVSWQTSADTPLLLLSIQPYRAQGAAIAVEDAAVLGALLSYVSSLSQVPALLRAYQDLRCGIFFILPTFLLPFSQTKPHIYHTDHRGGLYFYSEKKTPTKKKGYRVLRQHNSPPG
jgi:hypothetical protein